MNYSLGKQRRISREIKEGMTHLQQLEIELMREVKYQRDLGEILKALAVQKMKIHQHFAMKVAAKVATYREQVYEAGENFGRVLAKRLQQKEAANKIYRIQDHLDQIQDYPRHGVESFSQILW